MLRVTLVIVGLAVASVAHAARIDANSSWDEIRAAQGVSVRIPDISFTVDGVNYSVPATEVCLVDKDKFRTKEKHDIHSRSTSGRVDNSVSLGKDYLYTDRTHIKRSCVGGRSCKWVSETVETPLEYNLEVKEKSSRGDGRLLFEKKYTITACS